MQAENHNHHRNSQSGSNGIDPNQNITTKKIQDYIYNFNDLLGQGNFSKVYKGVHEKTGILCDNLG